MTPSLVLRQVRYTNKAFWRNPASAFFTFAFPLMFLVIFTSLLGDGADHDPGVRRSTSSTYYVMAEAAFGVISACYTNIAISVSFQRDQGILKRTRGTPLPGWAYMSARVVHAMVIAFVLVAITVAFGVIFYSASVPTGRAVAAVRAHVAGGRLELRGAGAGAHGRDPQRGRVAADRERVDPAAAVPVGHLLPDR